MNAQQRRQLEPLLSNAVRETGRELGRGAYGVVTEVIVSGTVCAAKKLHDAIVQDYTMRRFSDEVVLHSQQRHPNIVQLMGVYYPPRSQLPMIILEYLPFSLTHYLESKEIKLPLQMKYSILLDVAKGVCYLHGKRPPIVHRDLTANNVLLTSSYTAKISDLGVSRLADTFKKQQLTVAPGNAMVMPPEALVDDPVYDHKLDVFSYGCLILHVLIGQFPEPTDQFVPEPGSRRKSFAKVPEWDRRLRHIRQIPKENELLPLAKQCLDDDPTGRPEMIESYQFVEQVLLRYPKLKTIIELTQENEELTEEKSAIERQLHELAAKHSILEADKISMENQILHMMENFEKELKDLKVEKEEAIAALQRVNEQVRSELVKANHEYRANILQIQEKNEADLAKIRKEHEGFITKLRDEHEALVAILKNEHEAVVTKLKEDNEAITKLKDEHELDVLRMKDHISIMEENRHKTLEECETRVEVIQHATLRPEALVQDPLKIKLKNEAISFLLSQLSARIPSYNEQNNRIGPYLKQPLQKGTKLYLVGMQWMKQWTIFTGHYPGLHYMAGTASAYPGPVDNANLFKRSHSDKLKDHLMEELDYTLLPEPAWTLLVRWYGLSAESRPIARYVIEYGTRVKHLKVEVYKIELKLCVYPNINDFENHSFSQADKISDILTTMKKQFNVPDTAQCRIWHRVMTNRHRLMRNLQQELIDACIYKEQIMVLEVRNLNGTWPVEIKQ